LVTYNSLSNNLEIVDELLTKISHQLKKNNLKDDEEKYLSSNYKVLFKFRKKSSNTSPELIEFKSDIMSFL